MTTSAPETLPAEWYVSCDHFAREREAIFKRHWWMLARAEQLARPGDFVAGSVAGYPVFVIRGRDGGLLGFHNICRHRAGPVVRGGHGHCDVLRCRYHGWLYDLAGRLKKAPGITLGEDFEAADFSLFPIRVESWNGMVFACLTEEAPSLLEWLGDIPSIAEAFPRVKDMTFQGESLKEGACNWKAYGDNSCEGYHVGLVHGALGSAVDGEEVEIRPYEAGQFVGFDVTYRANRPSRPNSRQGKRASGSTSSPACCCTSPNMPSMPKASRRSRPTASN